jgi:hypothetical protein
MNKKPSRRKRGKEKDVKKKNLTTKDDFEFLCNDFLRWVVRFGLTDWEILFIHKAIDSEARVDLFHDDKIAHLTMATDWADHEVTKESLADTARHEAIHLCLAIMDHLCRYRYVTEKEIDRACEDATRRLCTGIGSLIEEIRDEQSKKTH